MTIHIVLDGTGWIAVGALASAIVAAIAAVAAGRLATPKPPQVAEHPQIACALRDPISGQPRRLELASTATPEPGTRDLPADRLDSPPP